MVMRTRRFKKAFHVHSPDTVVTPTKAYGMRELFGKRAVRGKLGLVHTAQVNKIEGLPPHDKERLRVRYTFCVCKIVEDSDIKNIKLRDT